MSQKSIIGIILAAGRSSRMGEINKLTKIWRGKPLIAHSIAAVRASSLTGFAVVTGHESAAVSACLDDEVTIVYNPEFATGMASSLRRGIKHAQQTGADAAMILLGDMPLVSDAHIDALIVAGRNNPEATIVQASYQGKPGNPVMFSSLLFEELLQLEGDTGARELIKRHPGQHVMVEIGQAAQRDFDTPAAFDNGAET